MSAFSPDSSGFLWYVALKRYLRIRFFQKVSSKPYVSFHNSETAEMLLPATDRLDTGLRWKHCKFPVHWLPLGKNDLFLQRKAMLFWHRSAVCNTEALAKTKAVHEKDMHINVSSSKNKHIREILFQNVVFGRTLTPSRGHRPLLCKIQMSTVHLIKNWVCACAARL